MLLLLDGRIAGVSGIVAGVLRPVAGDWGWRALFLAGLVVGGVSGRIAIPGAMGPMIAPIGLLIPAGLLVGFGTRLAGGCTSGHGVCGVSRGSWRSIVATATFMVTAAIVVFVVRHARSG
jgi:uncharacterized membrane protein YedE/YeeE